MLKYGEYLLLWSILYLSPHLDTCKVHLVLSSINFWGLRINAILKVNARGLTFGIPL